MMSEEGQGSQEAGKACLQREKKMEPKHRKQQKPVAIWPWRVEDIQDKLRWCPQLSVLFSVSAKPGALPAY